MRILVIAENDNSSLRPATRNTLSAAARLGDELDVLVVGSGCAEVATQAASLPGVSRVRLADHAVYEHRLAENVARLVALLAPDYSHVLVPATTFGKDLLPRAAALLGVNPLTDVVEIVTADTFKRPIYAGNAIATVQCLDPVKLLSVRTTTFDPVPDSGGDARIEPVTTVFEAVHTRFVSEELARSERPELTAARIVVSGGRGVGSADNFGLIYQLADRLGAAVGASRAAVDAGYVDNDLQVGQTGKVVAPEVYFAIGISGAIQHLAGMKDSRVIVAINKDADAPIFQVADYGLVADLFSAVPELAAKL
ncbi:MAG TPA: FAD-binding protein [Thiolinea sp.]|nr:FAD-binding protein [Thiolinea sp.]